MYNIPTNLSYKKTTIIYSCKYTSHIDPMGMEDGLFGLDIPFGDAPEKELMSVNER